MPSGQHNLKPPGTRMRNQLLRRYKESATERGLSFELTEEEFFILTQGSCYYCGIEPQQIYKGTKTGGDFIYNGIDRIDNAIGYKLDNCVSCCGTCNIAKRSMTQQQFINWISRTYNNLKERNIL